MKKKRKLILRWLLIVLIILILIFLRLKFTGYLIKEQKKQVEFYFYDELTNCSLDGYVFIGNKLIGRSVNGIFNLTYENYQENFNNINNQQISLFGKLGNCFNQNSDLFFDKYWESFEIKDYYFSGESVFNFKTEATPHNPTKRELSGFIQSEKVMPELNNINLNQNTLNDLSTINKYLNDKITYVEDWEFNKGSYWQTPKETLVLEQGDCEDYSTALLSLFLTYNSSLNCYNVVFTSHVTTFCYIEDYYIYYDQEKTELRKQINNKDNAEETKNQLKKLEQDYFKHYGINTNNETETRAHYAFNNNQFTEFNDENDFINWQYNLENTKKEFDLFEDLENQTSKVQQQSPLEELASEKPSIALATEKPTLKGFFIGNYVLLISAGIIIILLIIILIRINSEKN